MEAATASRFARVECPVCRALYKIPAGTSLNLPKDCTSTTCRPPAIDNPALEEVSSRDVAAVARNVQLLHATLDTLRNEVTRQGAELNELRVANKRVTAAYDALALQLGIPTRVGEGVETPVPD